MSHSCWVCNGGTALLDFDLGYHMGIRDNGGGEFLTSCFIGGLMTELRQDLYLLCFVSIQEASMPVERIVHQSFGHFFLFEFAIVMLIVSRFLLFVVYCVVFIVLYQLSHIIDHESLQPLSWICLITSSAYSENGNCPLHKESDWKEAGYMTGHYFGGILLAEELKG
ncbi:unnamed protein product [Prunus brigantina]